MKISLSNLIKNFLKTRKKRKDLYYSENIYNSLGEEIEFEDIDYYEETITEKIDFESLNKKFDDINTINLINNLDPTKISINSNLKEENEYLKNLLNEIENNDLIKDKIESAKIIKELTEENKILESDLAGLKNNFNIISKENDRLKKSLDIYLDKIKAYERELKRYKNKEKVNKKEYTLSDLFSLRAQGYTYRKIAKIYGVSPSTIHYRINKLK